MELPNAFTQRQAVRERNRYHAEKISGGEIGGFDQIFDFLLGTITPSGCADITKSVFTVDWYSDQMSAVGANDCCIKMFH